MQDFAGMSPAEKNDWEHVYVLQFIVCVQRVFLHVLPISCNAFFPCSGVLNPRVARANVSRRVLLQVLLPGVKAIALMGFLHMFRCVRMLQGRRCCVFCVCV